MLYLSIIEFLMFWRNLEKGVICFSSRGNEFQSFAPEKQKERRPWDWGLDLVYKQIFIIWLMCIIWMKRIFAWSNQQNKKDSPYTTLVQIGSNKFHYACNPADSESFATILKDDRNKYVAWWQCPALKCQPSHLNSDQPFDRLFLPQWRNVKLFCTNFIIVCKSPQAFLNSATWRWRPASCLYFNL